VRILRTFADNPAALVTANWETKRPGFLLTVVNAALTVVPVFAEKEDLRDDGIGVTRSLLLLTSLSRPVCLVPCRPVFHLAPLTGAEDLVLHNCVKRLAVTGGLANPTMHQGREIHG
jgi:hypothetical protein